MTCSYLAGARTIGKPHMSLEGVALLIIALIMQLRTNIYTPCIYWLTVVLPCVVGTQITDA